MKKYHLILKLTLAVLLNLLIISILVFSFVNEIKIENSSLNSTLAIGSLEKDEKNPTTLLILTFFEQLETGKITEAIETTEKIAFSKEFPDKLKIYFTDFYEYYNAIQKKQLKNCQIQTETFIKNSYLVKDYFYGTKYQYQSYHFVQIVPYFFIQIYNSSLKKQEKLYKLYLDYLCETDNYLSEKGAQIICLYIQERYQNHSKKDISLKLTQQEINHFTQTFPVQIGENGVFRTQSLYLREVSAFLDGKINALVNFSGSFPKFEL